MGRKKAPLQTYIVYFYFYDRSRPLITDVIPDEITAKDSNQAYSIGKKLIPSLTIPGFVYLNHVVTLKD